MVVLSEFSSGTGQERFTCTAIGVSSGQQPRKPDPASFQHCSPAGWGLRAHTTKAAVVPRRLCSLRG